MAKASKAYVCQACGAVTARWSGKCGACGEWNSIVEETSPLPATPALVAIKGGKGRPATFEGLEAETLDAPRFPTGIAEFDRVLGGGLVPGSAVLVGGDPGIGKSTLLLQVAHQVAGHAPTLYLSAEESAAQIGVRARRLGAQSSSLRVVADTDIESMLARAREENVRLLVVDSIQTVQLASVGTPAGAVTQLKECTAQLVRFAKSTGTTVIIVGHVTKDGAIAGPRVLEHLVDTVLYFESDSSSRFRNSFRVAACAAWSMRLVRSPGSALGSYSSSGPSGKRVMSFQRSVRIERTFSKSKNVTSSHSTGLPRRTAA